MAIIPLGDNGPPPDLRAAGTLEKGHSRIETRRTEVSAEAVPHLDWPGLAQIVRLVRTREIDGNISTEAVYLITSLPATDASPERLLVLNRARWAIKNCITSGTSHGTGTAAASAPMRSGL